MTQKFTESLSSNLSEVMQNPFYTKNYDKISKSCFLNIVEEKPNLKIIDALKSSGSEQDVNFCYNVIFLFATQCLHLDLSHEEVKTLLEEFTNNKDIISDFVGKYQQFQEFAASKDSNLKETKLDSSINFNRLVDVEWKMLHTISSKNLTKISKDVYLINLKYADLKGEIRTNSFKCSYEELLDLVENLNVACNTISKACESNELVSKQG